MQDVALIVINEAHCISQWGADFRMKFGELEKLCSYIALDIPILAASATLTPTVLAEVQQKLSYSADNTYLLDLGNDRHNIMPIVSHMKTARNLTALDFVLDKALCESGQPLVRTLIYVNTRELAENTWSHLARQLPADLRHQVEFIHARRSQRAKKRAMHWFCNGDIKILCATEVIGMVRLYIATKYVPLHSAI